MTHSTLSRREQQVVALLLEGKTNKRIAFTLGISERTVEFHLGNVYAKYGVGSRVELILRLGRSTGDRLWISPVDGAGGNADNRDEPSSKVYRADRLKRGIAIVRQEARMKMRWSLYFSAGLLFGALYWHYFSATALFFNRLDSYVPDTWPWLLASAFVVYFSVWLLPAVIPPVSEFRRSASRKRAALAAVTAWLAAVLGYYLNYVGMLALVGLPHMEHLVVLGQPAPGVWQAWGEVFPKLILAKSVKWVIASILLGGIAGLATGSIYSSMVRKEPQVRSA